MSGEGVKSRYVQQQVIDVDDVPGHQVRVQETHREYPADRQVVVEGEARRGILDTRILELHQWHWSSLGLRDLDHGQGKQDIH